MPSRSRTGAYPRFPMRLLPWQVLKGGPAWALFRFIKTASNKQSVKASWGQLSNEKQIPQAMG
jgi:hypothetical protein